MDFGFINVILLYIDNRHVSATHVTIFSVASARIYNNNNIYWLQLDRHPVAVVI
jgi:hypothetical protein